MFFEKYFTTSKNYGVEDDQTGMWFFKVTANWNTKSKTTGNRNRANQKSTI